MDQEALVVHSAEWWDRKRAKLSQLLRSAALKGLEIQAAGWLRTTEDGHRYLYLVSPWREAGKSLEGYSVLHSCIKESDEDWLNVTDIRLIRSSDLLGRALLSTSSNEAWDDDVYTDSDLGGVELNGPALIFAAPKPAPAAGS